MDPAFSPGPEGPLPSLLAGPATGGGAAGYLLALTPVLAQVGPVEVAVQLGILVLLLALSALFSGSEVALFSIRAAEREDLADDTGAGARRVRWFLDRPRQLLVAILILNTIVNVGAAVLSAQLMLAAPAAYGWSETVVLAVQVVALTFVLLVVSEIAPKLSASRHPIAFAKGASSPLYPLVRLVLPLAEVLARVMERFQERVRPPAEPLSAEDVRTMAEVGEAHGTLAEDEAALIHAILEFDESTAREVMVSRVDMVALPVTATLDEAVALIREAGHSRYPLYGASVDDILGVVYAKDLLPLAVPDRAPGQTVEWSRLARKARFVPPGRKLDDLLEDFQGHSTHMAIVVDEYGGTLGLVTLEDLLEEIVGEIRDELDHPDDEPRLEAVGPDAFRVDARIDLDDLFEALDMEVETEEFGFETLGGLVYHLAGAVPTAGQEVAFEGLLLRVEGVDENRIREVLVTRLPAPTAEGMSEAD